MTAIERPRITSDDVDCAGYKGGGRCSHSARFIVDERVGACGWHLAWVLVSYAPEGQPFTKPSQSVTVRRRW